MVTFLITSFAVLAVIIVGFYLWQKPSLGKNENALPPPNARGLFEEDSSANMTGKELSAVAVREQKEELLARARNGEQSALREACQTDDVGLYDRVLSELVQRADSDPKLLSLMSYVASQTLPVNKNLAQAVIRSWKVAPDRSRTAKALHFAALSNDAGVYRETVESALQLWQEGKLADISAVELRALFDGEFWVLSSRSRRSGAGFLLKRTLAGARRKLGATTGASQ
jgi:hypothetical protein